MCNDSFRCFVFCMCCPFALFVTETFEHLECLLFVCLQFIPLKCFVRAGVSKRKRSPLKRSNFSWCSASKCCLMNKFIYCRVVSHLWDNINFGLSRVQYAIKALTAKFPDSPILHYACGSMYVVLCFATKK